MVKSVEPNLKCYLQSIIIVNNNNNDKHNNNNNADWQ